jgi:hypothetical protein
MIKKAKRNQTDYYLLYENMHLGWCAPCRQEIEVEKERKKATPLPMILSNEELHIQRNAQIHN